jgi:peptide/nickel transport system substrate-binding protein
MLSTTYAEGAAWNDTNWSNARFNELLKAARGETDDKKRADMYAEMQTLVHTDGGAIVLVFNNYVSAHAKNLKYGKVAANWDNDGLKIAERWWFD